MRTLQLRGFPRFLLYLTARWSSPLPGQGDPLSHLRVHVVHVLQFGGVPLLLFPLAVLWGSALPGWGCPLTSLPARGLRTLLGRGPPCAHLAYALGVHAWGMYYCVWGSPSNPRLCSIGARCHMRGPHSPSSPWWLHALSAHDMAAGILVLVAVLL